MNPVATLLVVTIALPLVFAAALAFRPYRAAKGRVREAGELLGIDWRHTEFVPVEHHLAHASSAYHLSGFKDKTAILCVDGKGEYATTFFGYGENGRIHRLKEFFDPDSLGGVYGAITEYLTGQVIGAGGVPRGRAPGASAPAVPERRAYVSCSISSGLPIRRVPVAARKMPACRAHEADGRIGKRHHVHLPRRHSGRPQTVAGGFHRHAVLGVLFADETLFFRSGDDFAVYEQRGGRIMAERAG